MVRPTVLAALGATAAQALFGRTFKVTEHRGELVPWHEDLAVVPTVHPSAVLRAPDDRRQTSYEALVADLKVAAGRRPG